MDASAAPKFLFLFLLSILIVSSTGMSFRTPVKYFEQQQLRKDEQMFLSSRRELVTNTIQHDFTSLPTTTFPTNPAANPVTNPATNPVTNPANNPVTNPAVTNPVTNPAVTNPVTSPITNPVANPAVTNPVPNPVTVTAPPDTTSPGIITVPAATPVTVIPTPASNPAAPVTNPANNPAMPTTNPVTTPSINNPTPTGGAPAVVVAPPVAAANAPAVPGQSWCVAKSGVPEARLQAALDYACGIGRADCSAIQQGASCYNPNALQNHASYAFNSYYQRNPTKTSCDFGSTAVVINVNPSSGSCIFTTWSSSTSPTTVSPITINPTPTPTTASSSGATTPPITINPTPTPTTASSSGATTPIGFPGTPPTILNASNPAFGDPTTGFGGTPPNLNTSVSISTNMNPFISCSIIVVASIINLGIVL